MKAEVFEIARTFGDIQVAVRATADIGADEAVKQGVTAWDTLPLPGAPGVLAPAGSAPEPPLWRAAHDIVVRERGARRRYRNAVIFFGSNHALISFLASRIVPARSGALGALVRDCTTTSGRVDRSMLEERIDSAPEDDDLVDPDLSVQPRVSRTSLPLSRMSALHRNVAPGGAGRKGKGSHVFVNFGVSDRPLVGAAPASVEHRGATVPRMTYFVAFRRARHVPPHMQDHENVPPVFFFDGREHRRLESWEQMDAAAVERFDAAGRLYRGCAFDLFPASHLEAVCVVKVPPGETLRKLLAGDRAQERCPESGPLKDPAFVFDSRQPVPLRGDEPLVDDPRAAAWVLPRVCRGIYVPREAPRPVPAGRLPGAATYLVLARPRGAS